jgi:predicted nuclease with TOPRIM domain
MAARRIGAAAARWKSGEINAVAFADAVDRFADAVAELERENAALREHHQQDEALIVQRTDEIRHLETENAALRSQIDQFRDATKKVCL